MIENQKLTEIDFREVPMPEKLDEAIVAKLLSLPLSVISHARTSS